MDAINHPLSNIQLELLKLFSRDLPEQDLTAIKKLIVAYLSKRLSEEAETVWQEKGWTDEDMDNLLQQHLRTPYSGSK